ncbi:MAG: TonB family protein [Polyangiaceae bacterium]|nr:TonB family protein [Polyangiaceae bacterium]
MPRRRPRLLVALAASLSLGAAPALAQPGGPVARPTDPPADAPKKPAGLLPPVLKDFVDAPYPEEAKKQGKEGNVVLQLDIDADGNVTQATVIGPAGSGFDEAAVAAARRFKFSPATRDGRAIASRINYRYAFTLKADPTAPAAEPDKSTILSGVVDIGSTGEHLTGARVKIEGGGFSTEVTTSASGAWQVRDLPPGKYTVSVAAAGYLPLTVEEEVEAGRATEVLYRLSVVGGEHEVTVRGERPPREVTKRTIERREMSRIPGTNGDALRALQNLPGVARPPGLIGFLIVRGSAPNDTQVFIDGSLVPIAYHFGGLSSVVPTEMIERIDFYPGNFSSQYGRVMGGIIDVGIRSPKKDGRYHGLAQADLIDARLMAEGPVPLLKGWHFIAGARRSYVDVWMKPALEAADSGVTTAPVYYDYQAFVETEPTSKSKLRVGVYGADDRLEILIKSPLAADPVLGGNLGFHTGSWRLQGNYTHDLTDSTRLKAMLSYGKNVLDFSLGSMFFKLDVRQIYNRVEVSQRLAKGVTLNVGQDVLWAPYDIDIRFPQPPRPGEPDPGPFASRPPVVSKGSASIERPGAYAELELVPSDRVRIVAGTRADYASDSGHWDMSPRVNGRFGLHQGFPKTTLKGGFGVFHQPPQPQETNKVFGTPGVGSNRAIHYSTGIEQELTRRVNVSVEGFYKQLDSLVSRVPNNQGAFTYANRGSGYVVGAETLVRYSSDSRFFGWVAYTLSRSARRQNPGEELQLFQYDQTHILTALGSYRLGRGWEFGARFRFVSGPLDTPCNGGIYNSAAAAYGCIQGAQFSQRLPPFHQLDFRVDKQWTYQSWRLSAYLDLLNVYNRRSPEALAFNYNFTQSTYQTGLPIIPSIGVRAEF